MQILVLYTLIGAAAQLVGGSLGMGYGITSTTLLLAAGTAPAVASASVHFAQVGTSLVSGLAHWKFRNIDWKVVTRIAGPGAVGAVIGAFLLSSLSTEAAAPWMATLLVALGCYVIIRFSFRNVTEKLTKPRPGMRFLGPVGLIAGFVDSTGGGGWGPVATTSLLASGRLEPRKVIGSVATAEFVVTLAASLGFLVALGSSGLSLPTIVGLLVGGAIVAPFAAWLVRILPPRILGTAAGGLIVFTNAGTLMSVLGLDTPSTLGGYLAIVVGWAAALIVAIRSVLAERAAKAAAQKAETEPAEAR
ncbi:MAG: TSUP family transporter [Pseudonocardiaceae bacterium]|nr:TSUP family transporter [Pseudonocardiaceae bacterium]